LDTFVSTVRNGTFRVETRILKSLVAYVTVVGGRDWHTEDGTKGRRGCKR